MALGCLCRLLAAAAATLRVSCVGAADDLEAFRYLYDNREASHRIIAFTRVMKTGSSSLISTLQSDGAHKSKWRPYFTELKNGLGKLKARHADNDYGDLWVSGRSLKFAQPKIPLLADVMEAVAGSSEAPVAYVTIFRRPQDWLRSAHEHGRDTQREMDPLNVTEAWISSKSSGLQQLNHWMMMFPGELTAPFKTFLKAIPVEYCMGGSERKGCVMPPSQRRHYGAVSRRGSRRPRAAPAEALRCHAD